MITLSARFSFMPVKASYETKRKEKTMNPLTHFSKIRILPLLSLGTILALAISAEAQNLYVSAQVPPSHAILEFTPDGTQTTYASGLSYPRGLAFDSIGNFFAAHNPEPGDRLDIGRVLKFNLRNHVSTFGSAAYFFFAGLAMDRAGNAYVMATDDRDPTAAGTIFKFTPSGDRIVFGSVPGVPDNPTVNLGLAFDRAGYFLYATATGAQTIYKFDPQGNRTPFVGPDQFAPGTGPAGLAFDKSGNLFVSTEGNPGNDTIVYFTPMGVKTTFAMGLNTPRGLAFDTSGNLFVAEVNQPELNQPGDILEFYPDGTHTVFASFSSAQNSPPE
jgi:DNA-binding beta-propeller fold protein YncE